LLDVAKGSGICIGVENEASCLVCTGAETEKFLGHLPDCPELGVVWDPCNVLYLDGTNDPVHDDYPLIAKRIRHVHLKDANRQGDKAALRCVELGTGSVDFHAQLSALKAEGFRDWITLETHWRSVALDDESQHLPAGYAFSANAEPASRVCMKHLQEWIAAT
jgi:sugar phosphate isomerase/epimerase